MKEPERWTVTVGEATTSALVDRPDVPLVNSAVVLGHGASTSMEHRTMQNLARALTNAGLHVVRFNFMYTEQKRSPPDRMPRLMECFRAVVERVRHELHPDHLIPGGHSMGGRAASHLAAEGFACDGLLLLSYPLHPAGQPEKLRSEHLASIHVPVLCLNGTRDELCLRERMEPILASLPKTWTMHWLESADHSYHVLKRSGRTEEDVLEEITRASRTWAEQVVSQAR
jgi:predicted alpha/beta-hydrolase family hydrolase